jgi:3-oxoacyl-[acyl-carrier-protein] synthase-3
VVVQDLLGCRTVGALDVRDQCCGFLYALSVAEAFVKGGFHDHVLVIGSEIHSKGLNLTTAGRDTAVIFGDGAGAAVVGPAEEGKGILSSHLHSEGKHAKELCVTDPGFLTNPWLTHQTIDAGKHFPHMNGKYVFAHAVRRFPEVIRETLEKSGYASSDLSMLIPHQANQRITQAVGAALELPEATVRTRFFRARGLLREGLSGDVDLAIGDAFSFAGERCDRIVAGVLSRLAEDRASQRP